MNQCEHLNTSCKDSRRTKDGRWRRQECLDCGARFTTIEVVLGEKMARGQVAQEVERIKRGTLDVEQILAIDAMLEAFSKGSC